MKDEVVSRSRLARGWTVLRRRGPGYGLYLLREHLLPYAARRTWGWSRRRRLLAAGAAALSTLVPLGWVLRRRPRLRPRPALIVAGASLAAAALVARRRRQRLAPVAEPSSDAETAVWHRWPIDAATRRVIEAARRGDEPLVLARVDDDGRALGLFGPIPGWTMVDEQSFVERRRFPVEIVLRGDDLLVRKRFAGDRRAFRREALPLQRLAGHPSVPRLARLDEDELVLERHLLHGRTIRDALVERGAEILSVTTRRDPEMAELAPEERIEAVWRRAHPHLDEALPSGFIARLEEAMDRLHAAGVTGFSLTYGNVVIEPVPGGTFRPVFLDFDNARWHGGHIEDRGWLEQLRFDRDRDRDREKFRRIYSWELLTERSVRQQLAARREHWYAPIDFGRGLAIGGFWTTESGTGRWAFLNHRVVAPLVAGKRVLDLGSNNALMPLLMLRAGAARVLAVERSAELIETARLVHRVFEWRDLRRYALELRQADMRFILDEDPGEFDVVTAFCSLYYLQPDDMRRMVRRMAEIAPLVILQAKDDTRAAAADGKAEKSTAAYLSALLRDNGFPRVELVAPPGFSRPLLVARRPER